MAQFPWILWLPGAGFLRKDASQKKGVHPVRENRPITKQAKPGIDVKPRHVMSPPPCIPMPAHLPRPTDPTTEGSVLGAGSLARPGSAVQDLSENLRHKRMVSRTMAPRYDGIPCLGLGPQIKHPSHVCQCQSQIGARVWEWIEDTCKHLQTRLLIPSFLVSA